MLRHDLGLKKQFPQSTRGVRWHLSEAGRTKSLGRSAKSGRSIGDLGTKWAALTWPWPTCFSPEGKASCRAHSRSKLPRGPYPDRLISAENGSPPQLPIAGAALRHSKDEPQRASWRVEGIVGSFQRDSRQRRRGRGGEEEIAIGKAKDDRSS